MSNPHQEPKITDMIRTVCAAMYNGGECNHFAFGEDEMALEMARAMAKEHGITDEEQIEGAAVNWVDKHITEIDSRFKSSFITPIITRAFAKIGKVAKVSVTKNDNLRPVVTVTVTDETPAPKEPRKRGRKKVSVADCLESFEVDVSKLGDSELMVRDVNEIVRQMKEHIAKCGV